MSDIKEKESSLNASLSQFKSLLVAFSGGVDSSLLLATAQKACIPKLLAVTIASPLQPSREIEKAEQVARLLKVNHLILELNPLEDQKFTMNPKNRCYLCKRLLFGKMIQIAKDHSIQTLAHGVTIDDIADYRPGMQAAEELGFCAPLLEASLTKADIRTLSRKMQLPTWNDPSMACLASRIPFETPITLEKLRQIEKAENCLIENGMNACRVRVHDNVARIEVPPHQFVNIMNEDIRKKTVAYFKSIGFRYIALDLDGYRMGSMNPNAEKK
ncbi:ATP-dependent sacrificial sulfur transferase LarE [Desulfobacterales bacterium HSG17]|nr:ATP-dependent sacrificial sulfur transferase LarE [Desulfobacterales bacterium HSG17]